VILSRTVKSKGERRPHANWLSRCGGNQGKLQRNRMFT
jgi:hypothetical protein